MILQISILIMILIVAIVSSIKEDLTIMQTNYYLINEQPDNFKAAVDSWKSQGYDYIYYDNNACKEFLLQNFDPIYAEVFDKINIGAFKGDFFRYAWIYKMGGIYADFDSVCITKLELWLKNYPDIDIVLSRDDPTNKRFFYQAFIYCKNPGNQLMLDCINRIVQNVEEYKNGKHFEPFEFTGPGLVYNCFVEKQTEYKDKDLPVGYLDTHFGKMLILHWINDKLSDDQDREIVQHKCDTCVENNYWWGQLFEKSWVK